MRARYLALSLVLVGCGSKGAPPPAEPAVEPTCATGSHAVNGRCEPIDPPCPSGHALVVGQGCVGPATSASPPPPPTDPAGRHRLSDDLAFEDVVEGTGPVLPSKARVVVRYVGTLEDGRQIDKSQESAPPTFDLGRGHLIAGWEEGMPGMRTGGTRRLFIGPKKGYGQRGAPPRIPPNANLIFEIQLLSFEPPPPPQLDRRR